MKVSSKQLAAFEKSVFTKSSRRRSWVLAALMAGASAMANFAFAGEAPVKPETLPLWPDVAPLGNGSSEKSTAAIIVFHPAKPNGAAAVICPGGAYAKLSMVGEGSAVAQWLNQHGVTAAVLQYRLPQGNSFVPLLDAQRAIRLVRTNAQAWGVDPKRVGIIGFSAGGHLASTAGTHFEGKMQGLKDPAATDPVSCRPDFMILVYSVITMGEKTHQVSKNNLLGPKPKSTMERLFSNEKQVTAKTPPAFLTHAKDDAMVSPDNSRMFYDALRAHGIVAEYLPLPNGGHGLNGNKGPLWETWQAAALVWLAKQGLIPQADVQTAPSM